MKPSVQSVSILNKVPWICLTVAAYSEPTSPCHQEAWSSLRHPIDIWLNVLVMVNLVSFLLCHVIYFVAQPYKVLVTNRCIFYPHNLVSFIHNTLTVPPLLEWAWLYVSNRQLTQC